MVGAPDIDDASIPAFKLAPMIGDIAGEIGERPVAFDDSAVLVITKFSRPEPLGSLILINQIPAAQELERAFHVTARNHGSLADKRIEGDPELTQIIANPGEQILAAKATQQSNRFLGCCGIEPVSPLLARPNGQFLDVFSRIAVCGKRRFSPR